MTNPHMTPLNTGASVLACSSATLPESGYLLLDPDAFPDSRQVAQLHPTVCRPTNWGQDTTGLPVLVSLARCDSWQTKWLRDFLEAEHGNSRYTPLMRHGICAHIETDVGIDELAVHLANEMLVLPISKDGNRTLGAALWRFFDPRVFANLCWMLEAAHLKALVGPVAKWTFPWLGTTYVVDLVADEFLAGKTEQAFLRPERIAGCAPIDIGVWERAQRISNINQVLMRLRFRAEPSWGQRAAFARSAETALADAAHRLHWGHTEDLVLYADHVVRYGAAFVEHHKLVACWAQIAERAANMRCADVIALLAPDEYAALAAQATALSDMTNDQLIRGAKP
jgi:hypothetical protein